MSDLDDLAAKAEAATPSPWIHWHNESGQGVHAPDTPASCNMTICGEADAAHIAANSPSITLALVKVARADDPEPPYEMSCFECCGSDTMVCREGDCAHVESPLHIAWRIREEARANLNRALEENRG